MTYPPQPPIPPAYGGPPKTRAKPWVWIVAGTGVVAALCLVLGAFSNLTSDTPTGDGPAPVTGEERVGGKPVPEKATLEKGIGDAVRDGKFEFVVTRLDCSRTTLGGSFLSSTAQGKYCVVSLTVKNIGDEAQLFSGGNQKAYDAKGATFSNDGGAEFYANESNETFLNDINPGNKVSGKVVFDVPKATELTAIELHDSIWSRGVKVTLK